MPININEPKYIDSKVAKSINNTLTRLEKLKAVKKAKCSISYLDFILRGEKPISPKSKAEKLVDVLIKMVDKKLNS